MIPSIWDPGGHPEAIAKFEFVKVPFYRMFVLDEGSTAGQALGTNRQGWSSLKAL
jgi:hypothetical protein